MSNPDARSTRMGASGTCCRGSSSGGLFGGVFGGVLGGPPFLPTWATLVQAVTASMSTTSRTPSLASFIIPTPLPVPGPDNRPGWSCHHSPLTYPQLYGTPLPGHNPSDEGLWVPQTIPARTGKGASRNPEPPTCLPLTAPGWSGYREGWVTRRADHARRVSLAAAARKWRNLADAQASEACGRKPVGVRIPPSAPIPLPFIDPSTPFIDASRHRQTTDLSLRQHGQATKNLPCISMEFPDPLAGNVPDTPNKSPHRFNSGYEC